MEKFYGTNLRYWNELVDIHAGSREYDLEGFLEGGSSLHSIELEALGDVSGKSLLHLQCHFGLDTLNWARLGAEVTGVDFSENAIQLARHLAERVRVPALHDSDNRAAFLVHHEDALHEAIRLGDYREGGLGDAVAGPVEAEVLRSDALSRMMALSFSSYPRMVKQLETP